MQARLFIQAYGEIGKKQTGLFQNYYLCGGQIQSEDAQGNGDDTAVNGFSFIFCNKNNWNDKIQKWYEGKWGDWKPRVYCPVNTFVSKMKIRWEGSNGGYADNTAINGVKFLCIS